MSSDVDICNKALRHLAIGKRITDLTTENSAEANACREFFTDAKEATLRDFAWPFATKIATLALVEENPTDEWLFSYQYPSDCLSAKRIPSGVRVDTLQSRTKFRILRGSPGKVIYTDKENAELEYTVQIDNSEEFDADFSLAMSWRLAAYLAPSLTGGDPFKLGPRALQMYQSEIELARSNAKNEESQDEAPESEFINVR